MQVVSGDIAAKNEYEYIDLAFDTTKAKWIQALDMVQQIAPVAFEQLLHQIFSGNASNFNNLNMMSLKDIVGYHEDDKYIVLLVRIVEPVKPREATEAAFFMINARNIADQLARGSQTKRHSIQIDDINFAILWAFAPDTSDAQIENCAMDFRTRFEAKLKAMSYKVDVGIGGTYCGVSTIADSFRDAEEDISYRICMEKMISSYLHLVAEHIGITPSYLSTLFKERVHMNFLDYLNDYRVTQARALLEHTDLPVKEIGFQTGFYSPSTFFRVFKKVTGDSPGQFRAGNR